jgi:AcrR family transcriptional regulator
MGRAYESSLRGQQARQTRERVLDAMIAALARQEDISVGKLAKAAGVSIPTVYRYFPTREALMDAVQNALGTRLGRPRWPESAVDLVARVPQRYAWFDENGLMMRAILSSSLGREVRRAVQRGREQGLMRAMSGRCSHLDAPRARAAVAIIGVIDHAMTWRELRDEWVISGENAAGAAQWAVSALLERLEHDGRAAKGNGRKNGKRRV